MFLFPVSHTEKILFETLMNQDLTLVKKTKINKKNAIIHLKHIYSILSMMMMLMYFKSVNIFIDVSLTTYMKLFLYCTLHLIFLNIS